jgi:hypothetical protein
VQAIGIQCKDTGSGEKEILSFLICVVIAVHVLSHRSGFIWGVTQEDRLDELWPSFSTGRMLSHGKAGDP